MRALQDQVDDICELVTSEMGLPISLCRQTIPGAFAAAEFFIGAAESVAAPELRPGQVPAAVLKEPVGVVAAIAPWNGPFNLAISKIVPALLMGCSVVFKPAPETPLDVYLIVEAFNAAGLPGGVLNLVTGDRQTGDALVRHSGVDKVSFTGSTAAGRQIGEICGGEFKRVTLELGGKSAAIVLEDADLASALPGIAAGSFFNTGQVCASYSRVLAPRSRYDEVVGAVSAAAQSFVLGDPFEPATTMGPLVAERQRERVESYIAAGKSEGARIVTGGRRPADLSHGWYVEPTVFADADNSMRISREEIFGPVVAVIPYEGESEAIDIANDSPYGLHGAVFTEDDDAALRVAGAIRTGTFSINSFTYNVEAPFGGVKCSGVGRDTGREALESFIELKTVNLTSTTVGRFLQVARS
jgi:acyl-CoA reductase-like NAD-dependent aldehyde dehydrogenase